MALIARIVGSSLLTAALGWWLGFVLFGQSSPSSDWIIISLATF
jgi:hypothetical protein